MSGSTPQWLDAVQREAQVREGLVLYGQTRDLFWSGAGADYVTLPRLLWDQLPDFDARACWGPRHGLRFASRRDAERWTSALEEELGGDDEAGSGQPYDLGGPDPDGAPPARSGSGARRGAETAPAEGRQVPLEEVLAQYRRLLDVRGLRPLLVVDWSHLLVTQADHPSPEERIWIQELGAALVGGELQRIDSDELTSGRGLLVLLSATLGALPPVVYQGEPRIRVLSVPPPGREARRAFFDRHADDLRLQPPRVAPGLSPVGSSAGAVESMAELCDQLTTVDLRQIVSLSRSCPEPLPPDRLLNLYRFGDQRSPWEELSEERLHQVDAELGERVLGQEAAVERVATMILRAWLGLAGLQHSARRMKPKGTLFFVGPTGVGKTELAKACAAFLFGDESACVRFDMSEYNHEHSDNRFVGAPPGYVGFEEGGQLTNAVRERPFSVLLFDEIEKGHGRVLDKFLQILEDGRLTDGRGETAWFSEAVIIFTSNIGASTAPAGASPLEIEAHYRDAVERHFVDELGRPELLNRLGDNIVVFQPIADAGARRRILERKLQPLYTHCQARWDVGLELESPVLDWLVSRARAEHGGRGLVNAVERDLLDPLARFLFRRHEKLRRGRTVRVALQDGAPELDLVDG